MKVVVGHRYLSPLAIGPDGQGYIAYAQTIDYKNGYVVELDDQLQQHVVAAVNANLPMPSAPVLAGKGKIWGVFGNTSIYNWGQVFKVVD